LIAFPCFDLEVKNADGYTALNFAALHGHKESVFLLLHHDANPEAMDKEGNTPLMQAAKYGHLDIVKMLLEKNAKINVENTKSKDTAIDFAMRNMHKDVVLELINHLINNDIESLVQRMKANKLSDKYQNYIFIFSLNVNPINIDLIKHCLKKDVLDSCDNDGFTPLHHLVIKILEAKNHSKFTDYLIVLSLMLKEKFNLCAETKSGDTIFTFCKTAFLTLPANYQHKVRKLTEMLVNYAFVHADASVIIGLKQAGFYGDVDERNLAGETLLYRALTKKPIDDKEVLFLRNYSPLTGYKF
jgi:ankyrin repeat protein